MRPGRELEPVGQPVVVGVLRRVADPVAVRVGAPGIGPRDVLLPVRQPVAVRVLEAVPEAVSIGVGVVRVGLRAGQLEPGGQAIAVRIGGRRGLRASAPLPPEARREGRRRAGRRLSIGGEWRDLPAMGSSLRMVHRASAPKSPIVLGGCRRAPGAGSGPAGAARPPRCGPGSAPVVAPVTQADCRSARAGDDPRSRRRWTSIPCTCRGRHGQPRDGRCRSPSSRRTAGASRPRSCPR